MSLLSSLYAALFAADSKSMAVWAACLCAAELGAARYMQSFWAGVRKVPLMDDYNDAISDTHIVVDGSLRLAWCWGALAGFKMLGF